MKRPAAELAKSAVRPEDFPRTGLPEVAVVGRSNVGKSSLLNRLTGIKRLAFVSKTPGRTQLVNFFRFGNDMMLVDLPGYGFAKVPASVRNNWEAMVTGYLFDRPELCLVLLLVDSRRDPMDNDIQVRDLLEERGITYAVVATKADKTSAGESKRRHRALKQFYGADGRIPVIIFSAVSNEGRKELWKVIETHVREARQAPKKS